MGRDRVVTAEQRVQCRAAEALSAVLVAASSPPPGVRHPRPAVVVLVGVTNETRPPRRRGRPWRIYVRAEVLAGPTDDLLWTVAHETAHVCLGHEERWRLLRSPWSYLYVPPAGAVLAGPGVWLSGGGYLSSARALVGLAVLVCFLPLFLAVRWSQLRWSARPAERDADHYAAAVLGVAMTAAARDRSQEIEQDWFGWVAPFIRDHPWAVDRYAATVAAVRSGG